MDRRRLGTLIVALTLISLACGVVDTALNSAVGAATGGSGNMNAVSTLWNDVPRMDGMTQSDAELPAPMKLMLRAAIGNMGLLNGPGQDRTTGNIDWIAFTTAKTPSDITNYYTNARMAASGWKANDQSPCLSGAESGAPTIGLFCGFQKEQGSRQTVLGVIGIQDDQAKTTNVFFLRLQVTATPVPNK